MTRDVARLGARTFDVLVIGGGIYGLIVAADAADRGLSVALVERGDFGGGASFNHLRTLHGGLRYLQTLSLSRARESIRERRTLARIAPQAIGPLPFVLPLRAAVVKGPLMMRAGLALDALIARDRNDGVLPDWRLPAGRVLARREVQRRYPAIGPAATFGAAVWHDFVTLEADRLTIAWALAAADRGAVLVNYATATSLIVDGGRVVGARVENGREGGLCEVAASVVVNATGADLDGLLEAAGAATGAPMLRAMNLVTRLDGGDAALGGQAASGRALFMVPWRGRALFGTWESAAACRPSEVRPPEAEVEAFIREIATAFPGVSDVPLTPGAVTYVHRGVVPAVTDGRGGVALSGRQVIVDHANGPRPLAGLISAAGIKYTTARATAEAITDRVFAKLARPAVPCRTAVTTLAGWGPDAAALPPTDVRTADPEVMAHLTAAYGTGRERVLALTGASPALADRVDAASPVIGAQLVHAVRHEMAVTLADAVMRRTPLGALGHPGQAALARAASVMAGELGWSAERVASEIRSVEGAYGR